MAGKTFTHIAMTKQETGLALTQQKHLTGLLNNTREAMQGVTPSLAYTDGLSLSKALKHRKSEVKIMLLAELERLTRHVNATRTFQTQTDLQDAVDDICELFPSMKLEEILVAFKHIRQGRFQLFGNFTTNVMLECLRQYEMQHTVTFREQEHYDRKKTVQTASLDVKRLLHDLEKDGKLRNPRKILDRTFIPYPNDKEDTKSAKRFEEETTATQDGTETNNTRID